MILTLKRKNLSGTFTEGHLYYDGIFFSDSLEDPVRDNNKDGDLDDPGEGKVYGNTAIPYGKYEVKLTYSNRFKKIMPEVLNVPGFSGIRIHAGNTVKDTLGCILVGEKNGTGQIGTSRDTYDRLLNLIKYSIEKKGETVQIEIV